MFVADYVGLPEDSRISKVLRRMSREDDPDKFIAFCNQLQVIALIEFFDSLPNLESLLEIYRRSVCHTSYKFHS